MFNKISSQLYITENIIDIALDNYEDIYNKWDSSEFIYRDLNSGLKAFLEEYTHTKNFEESIFIRFNIKKKKRDSNMEKILEQSLYHHFSYSHLLYNKKLYENRKKTIYYSITSILFIIISIYFQNLHQTSFFKELILYSFTISSWVFLWEAISLIFIQRNELLKGKRNYKKLLKASIVYKY